MNDFILALLVAAILAIVFPFIMWVVSGLELNLYYELYWKGLVWLFNYFKRGIVRWNRVRSKANTFDWIKLSSVAVASVIVLFILIEAISYAPFYSHTKEICYARLPCGGERYFKHSFFQIDNTLSLGIQAECGCDVTGAIKQIEVRR